LSSKQKLLPNFLVGQSGERRAAHFLEHNGFQVIDQNVQIGADEIDLVAIDLELKEVVFVEVKSRGGANFGDPSSAVGWRKMRAQQRIAEKYLRMNARAGKVIEGFGEELWEWDYRFDILSVLPNSITHYQNVTWRMVK
jgi:putative endonuclease